MKNFNKFISITLGFMIALVAIHIAAFFGHPILGLVYAALQILIVLGIIKVRPKGSFALTTFYEPSTLALGQMKLIEKFASAAKKAYEPQTYLQFRRSGAITDPDYKMLRTREDRTLAAYFPLRTARALGSGRSYNFTGNTGTTNVLTPGFLTYSDGFSLSLKLMDNNVYTWAEAYANEIDNVMKNFAEGNETNATNYLYNNRSLVNISATEGAYNPVTSVFEINEGTTGSRVIQVASSMMNDNRWQGWPLTIFCDSILFNKAQKLNSNAEMNADNTAFQIPGKTYVLSIDLNAKAVSLGYTKGFGFAVPDGTISVLDWIPKQNRNGVELVPQKWYSILNPQDGLIYAMYSWYIGTDTYTGSVAQDAQLNYQISVDLAYEYAPLTTANETPIQAFALT